MEMANLLFYLLAAHCFAIVNTSESGSYSSSIPKETRPWPGQPYSPWYDHFWAQIGSNDYSASVSDGHIDHPSAIHIVQRQDEPAVTRATTSSANLPTVVTGRITCDEGFCVSSSSYSSSSILKEPSSPASVPVSSTEDSAGLHGSTLVSEPRTTSSTPVNIAITTDSATSSSPSTSPASVPVLSTRDPAELYGSVLASEPRTTSSTPMSIAITTDSATSSLLSIPPLVTTNSTWCYAVIYQRPYSSISGSSGAADKAKTTLIVESNNCDDRPSANPNSPFTTTHPEFGTKEPLAISSSAISVDTMITSDGAVPESKTPQANSTSSSLPSLSIETMIQSPQSSSRSSGSLVLPMANSLPLSQGPLLTTGKTTSGTPFSSTSSERPLFPFPNITTPLISSTAIIGSTAFPLSSSLNSTSPNTLLTISPSMGTSSSVSRRPIIVVPPFPMPNSTNTDGLIAGPTSFIGTSDHTMSHVDTPSAIPERSSSFRASLAPFPFPNATQVVGPTNARPTSFVGTSIQATSHSDLPSAMPGKPSFSRGSLAPPFPFPNATQIVGSTSFVGTSIHATSHSDIPSATPENSSSVRGSPAPSRSSNATQIVGSTTARSTSSVRTSNHATSHSGTPSTMSGKSSSVRSSSEPSSSSSSDATQISGSTSMLVTSLITTTDSQGHTTTSATVIRTSRPASITAPPSISSSGRLSASLTASENGSWVYYGPELWNMATPTIGCIPPCCISLPDMPQSSSASAVNYTWPIFKTSYLTLEGSSDLVSVTTMKAALGETYTLCSRPGAKFQIKPTWITIPPFSVPVNRGMRPFCAATVDKDKKTITYSDDSPYHFDPCQLQNIKPPSRYTMSLEPGAMWIRPHNWKDDPKYWALGLCTNTTVPIAIEPTAKLECSAPTAVWSNKPAGPTCTQGSEGCPPAPPVVSEDKDDDSDSGHCTGGLLGFWPFNDLICYCGLFGCATGCGLTGCINPCGFLEQLLPGPIGLVPRVLCHNWGKLDSLSDGGQKHPDPPGEPEDPEDSPDDDCTEPKTSKLVKESCDLQVDKLLPSCTATETVTKEACTSTVSTTTTFCSLKTLSNTDYFCTGNETSPCSNTATKTWETVKACDGTGSVTTHSNICSQTLVTNSVFVCPGGATSCVSPISTITTMTSTACSASATFVATCAATINVTPDDQDGQSGGPTCPLVVDITPDDQDGEAGEETCPIDLDFTPDDQDGLSGGSLGSGLPPSDFYNENSAGKFNCETPQEPTDVLNYIKWFSPAAQVFCKRPPSFSTFSTDDGPRNVSHQEWKFEGNASKDIAFEFAAVGPPGEVKNCEHYELDFNNCVKYLELAFYQDCFYPSAPENVEAGSISGGSCIAYHFGISKIESGEAPPIFKMPSWLWPYSIDLYGQDQLGKSHCGSNATLSNATLSIDYKKWFSGMAKTFCKSPPEPTKNETDNGNRTVWEQQWSYGSLDNSSTSVVDIVAIKSGAESCATFEFSQDNCEKYLDSQLHSDCHSSSDPGSLISGSISGGACIAYSIELSTFEGKVGVPSLFKEAPVTIKKPGDQMAAHEFTVSYDWSCDVEFNKISRAPNCSANWGLWARWEGDKMSDCESVLDKDPDRFNFFAESATLPGVLDENPLDIKGMSGLPMDLGKTWDPGFKDDCLKSCRFNLGRKDDYSDSNVVCNVDDTCSKRKSFGCVLAPKNLTISCPTQQDVTGDRRIENLFFCNSSIPTSAPPPSSLWDGSNISDIEGDDKNPTVNLLGFPSADDYEFGLFAAMDCPAPEPGAAGNIVQALMPCKRHYYALYAGLRGTSMLDCDFLRRGKVTDPAIWVDDTYSIPKFDPNEAGFPIPPSSAPPYEQFPHKVGDHDSCAANCFFLNGTDELSSTVECKKSPDASQKPCFPPSQQKCTFPPKNQSLTCAYDGVVQTTYYPVAYCNDKVPAGHEEFKENDIASFEFGLFAAMRCPKGSNQGCSSKHYSLYAGIKGKSMNECPFLQREAEGIYLDDREVDPIADLEPTTIDFPKTPDSIPHSKDLLGGSNVQGRAGGCKQNCYFVKDTGKDNPHITCVDIDAMTFKPVNGQEISDEAKRKTLCMPPGVVGCDLVNSQVGTACSFNETADLVSYPIAYCNDGKSRPATSRYLLGERSTLADYQFAFYAAETCHACAPLDPTCTGHTMVLKASIDAQDMGTCDFFHWTSSPSVWNHTINVDDKKFSCDSSNGHMRAQEDFPQPYHGNGPYQGSDPSCWSNCHYHRSEKKIICDEILDPSKPSCFPPGELKCEWVDSSYRFRCEQGHLGRNDLTVTPGAYCRSSPPQLPKRKNTCFLKFKVADRPIQAAEQFVIYISRDFEQESLVGLLKKDCGLKGDRYKYGTFDKDRIGMDQRPTDGFEAWLEGWILLGRLQCVGEALRKIGGDADECVKFPEPGPDTNTCVTTPVDEKKVKFRVLNSDLSLNLKASFDLRAGSNLFADLMYWCNWEASGSRWSYDEVQNVNVETGQSFRYMVEGNIEKDKLLPFTLLLYHRVKGNVLPHSSHVDSSDQAVAFSDRKPAIDDSEKDTDFEQERPPSAVDPTEARLVWGPWRLPGVLGIINNVYACCYMVFVIFWSVWPPATPVSASTMNYSIVVTGGVMILSGMWYFVGGRKQYRGPIVDDDDAVVVARRSGSIDAKG
ncbi:hypothetical protein FKW77_007073 [Venturia effusa]|uniref:Uncharacterized protein n=1 Tax=Venturia effusa TaxID=50376 RepID=A0A517LN44_9PEZI|nr:hypothetical protein FKW77_007073 [Venturia effusa]